MSHWIGIGGALVLAAALGPLTCLEGGEPTDPVTKRTYDIWVNDCAQCHGMAGEADGKQAAELDVHVPDFRDPCRPITDEWIEKVILSGGASYGGAAEMRPHHKLEYDREVLEQLVTFVQGLRDKGECHGPGVAVPPVEVPP